MSKVIDNTRRILSPREYVHLCVGSHPTLFYGRSYDESALKVFDHFFNVIGNGFNNFEEMLEAVSWREVDEHKSSSYMTGEPIYQCYREKHKSGFGGSGKPVVLLESELKKVEKDFSYVVLASRERRQNHSTNQIRSPYPNFEAAYSSVYIDGFKELGKEWTEAAIFFYTKCKEFFENTPVYYSRAFPRISEDENLSRVWDMEYQLRKYATWDEITDRYGVEYKGDVEDFLLRRWEKEYSRITTFINDTLMMLNAMLSEQKELTDAKVGV